MKIVNAENVNDYLQKYYKSERLNKDIIESYNNDFKENGFVCTSRFDNITGEFIAWPFYVCEDNFGNLIDYQCK